MMPVGRYAMAEPATGDVTSMAIAERFVAFMLRRVIFTGWEMLETLGNLLHSVAGLKI